MENKKLTKREYFKKLRVLVENDPELVAFIDNELDLLDRKSSNKKPTKNQENNEVIKKDICNYLQEVGIRQTATEIWKALPNAEELSNQKVSSLIRQLKLEGIVDRQEEKGVAYFTLK